jgi:glycine hydroxymethyltransferase
MHVIAAKAVAFKEALTPAFPRLPGAGGRQRPRTVAVLAEERGLRIVSGRTESHVFLVDLRAKNITGKDAEAPWAPRTSRSTRTRFRTIRRSPS